MFHATNLKKFNTFFHLLVKFCFVKSFIRVQHAILPSTYSIFAYVWCRNWMVKMQE